MSVALRRILYATCESARALFALVAREPRSDPTLVLAPVPAPAPAQYCHAFETDTPEQVPYVTRNLSFVACIILLSNRRYTENIKVFLN